MQNLTDKYNDLISDGKTEDAAYHIAVASIGDVSGLIRDNGKETAPVAAHDRNRSGLFTAIAVALYILCVVPCILLQNEAGVVVMFVMIALATGLLIYNNHTKNRYQKEDDTMVEEFKAWKEDNKQNRQAEKAITGALWLITVGIYFYLSFATGAWHITWLVYLICAAVCMVVKGIFDLQQ